tara:strand:+ start:975 stop:1340 length:366 start_codon:yes stop_codon:yes gene_type:complete
MDKEVMDRQTRAILFSAIGRDFQLINIICIFANIVTLSLICTGNIAVLPLSIVIIGTLVFALIAGLNQIDTFKAWIMDMDKQDTESNMGIQGQKAPFAMWKTVFSLTYLAIALGQLYEILL